MSGPIVILIGPMGAGKTSVGRELATRLDVDFADLDSLIVETEGRSIPEIFDAEGEDGFREIEASVLSRALREHRGVLALGGGAPMHPASRELLRGRRLVLLEVSERVAARRLGRGHGRPMLSSGGDPMGRWRELLELRGPVFRDLARWRIDAGAGSASAVARTITDTLQRDLLSCDEEDIP